MAEHAENALLAVAVERLTEAVHTSRSDVADAAAVLVNVGDLRRLLRAVSSSGPLIPGDDVSRYANPEGAQESIIQDCLRAYVEERVNRPGGEGR